MRQTRSNIYRASLLAAAVIAGVSAALVLAEPATMPATMPGMMATTVPSEMTSPGVALPVTQPTTQSRGAEEILKEIQAVGAELGPIIGGKAMTDPALRAAATPKALPMLKKLQDLATELEGTGDEGKQAAENIHAGVGRYQLIFEDPDTVAGMKKKAADANPEIALVAQKQLLFADWLKSNKDAAVQDKLMTQAETLAKAHTADTDLTQLLMGMSEMDPATPELKKRATDAALAMNNAAATQAKEQIAADAKQTALVSKPLTIAGTTVDGKAFTTGDWKGKVILVDFWATWCGPCRAELPRVKKAYADFHGKGLEILGVSNDQSADELKKFVAADPGMPWPQLLDEKAAAAGEWNPITSGYGIMGIPTMFLIDKKGVCRTVTARADFETEIPKLLAE